MAVSSTQAPYNSDFYSEAKEGSLRSARCILPRVFQLAPAHSVLDVGCGIGTWLKAVDELGISDYLGLDGSYVDPNNLLIPRERFMAADLSQSRPLGRRFDLVMSLEVAEHLSPESADPFVGFLVAHGDVVLFSASPPFQGGTDHRNEQWPSYWAAKFAAHGYSAIDALRLEFFAYPQVDWYYAQNALIYANADGLKRCPGLSLFPHTPPDRVAPLAHRLLLERWAYQLADRVSHASFRELVTALPSALRRSLSYHLGNAAGKEK